MKQHFKALLLLAVCVGGLVFALVQLLHVRLERGDMFPPGSSLRVDPLGTKALAESLDALPGIKSERNYRHWRQIDLAENATLYVLNVYPERMFERDSGPNRLLDFVARGGRVIVAHADNTPDFAEWDDDDVDEAEEDDQAEENEKERTPAEEETDTEEPEASEDELMPSTWSLEITEGEFDSPTAKQIVSVDAPEKVFWRGQDYFSEFDEKWEVLYETSNGPVVLHQRYGKGEVIALADPYLLSNEALLLHRESAWLGWLHGDSEQAIFDEWHFGLQEPTGVVILMRRYRLGGLALGLALLTTLFVWRNLYSLTPVRDTATSMSGGVVRLTGSTHTGLRNLLKRSIAPEDLLSVCVERLEKLGPQLQRMAGWKEAQKAIRDELSMHDQQAPRKRRPVAAYRRIKEILTQHRINLR
ncbi:DUF4350 domain-containing protein [Cerasicoccus frondis]|uniref:DUF4350 domain-containing protein n=1 Tax=Cerasicoccus frondis TaxID=490090 RepID=UPI0028525BF0|nr:DUF4350 domain-containing protein [Cerasicoccus frondis]